MNFDYSDEQKLVKDEARRFLARACSTTALRAVLQREQTCYDRALWQAVAGIGWLGMGIPEAYGGLGLAGVDICAVAEELGRALAPIPFASTIYLFSQALLLAGSQDQQSRLLPAVAQGKLIGCLATSERPGALQPETLTVAVANGLLNGTKIPVLDGDIADAAIVLALEAGRPKLFIVDLTASGVTRRPLKTLDPTRGAALLHFDAVPAEPLGTEPGDAATTLQIVLNRGAALLAFEQLGGADRCLERARDYALERHAFGRPIGSFQAIKHRLAEMYVRNQIARSNAYYGAWALDHAAALLGRAAAAARVACSEAFWYASKESIEVFGGIGTTWESDCHLYYRRAKYLALAVGAPVVWKERLVVAIEQDEAA